MPPVFDRQAKVPRRNARESGRISASEASTHVDQRGTGTMLTNRPLTCSPRSPVSVFPSTIEFPRCFSRCSDAREIMARVTTKTCQWDNRTHPSSTVKLSDVIDAYEHDNGWALAGFEHRLWLSLKCPGCGYDWPLDKLGVQRS